MALPADIPPAPFYNAGRSLLLNLDGRQPPSPWVLAEEPVDANYRAFAVPSWLAEIRTRLFGVDPDRSLLNYRAVQYLSVIAASELNQYLLDLDGRITHAQPDPALFLPATYQPQIESGNPARLVLAGTPASPDASGRMYHAYELSLAGSTLSLTRRQPRPGSWSYVLSFTASLSQPVPLGDSGYTLRCYSGDDSWAVSFHLRPTWDLGQILAGLSSLSEPSLLRLFGAAPTAPFDTFQNCFNRHSELAYRLGGFLLAVIYRSWALQRGTHG